MLRNVVKRFFSSDPPSAAARTTITFPLQNNKRPLGYIRIRKGFMGLAPSTKYPVAHLKYSSPLKGFRPQSIVVLRPNNIPLPKKAKSGYFQMPVGRENEHWEWATPPPPGWKTGKGIPYDLDEAMKERDGRPYGFDRRMWKELKANFLRNDNSGKRFPQDWYIPLEQIILRKEQKTREKKRQKVKTKKKH